MNRLRVGVIGTGSMGRNHLRIYDSLSHEVELIGIYDADLARARDLANQYDTLAFHNIESLLNACEAISIAVPTVFHFDIAMLALEFGVNILIEKPIAASIEEANKIISLAKNKDLTVQIGHVERFNPAIRELSKLVVDQKPIGIDIKRMSPYDGRISDVDVIQDLMIHDIDIVLNLFGNNIIDIKSMGKSVFSQGGLVDYAVATLQFADGMVANITASRVTQEKIRKLGLSTENSYIELDYIDKKINVSKWTNMKENFNSKDMTYKQESIVSKIFVPNEEPLLNELKSFVNVVKNRKEPVVTAYDGLNALEICDKIRENIYNNKKIGEKQLVSL